MTTPTSEIINQAPWHVEQYDALGLNVCRRIVKQGESMVAAAYGADNEAIAHLISAAPDLLSELKRLLDGHWVGSRESARAAVAKAEGRVES